MLGPRNCLPSTHVFYADDIMVYFKGTRQNLSKLFALFYLYGAESGQHLSLEKCRFFAGSMAAARISNLKNFFGFRSGSLLFTYLGVPIFLGKPRKMHLLPIAGKIKSKLSSWKGSTPSFMGRVQLVKSIIQGMMVYSFHVYLWPVSLLKSLDRSIRNFI